MMAEITLTAENFASEVLHSDRPVLVDFWASWCRPCRMMAPVVEAVAESRTDVKVAKLNVDDAPELAMQFGVMSIPTFIVFKDGQAAARKTGGCTQAELEAML